LFVPRIILAGTHSGAGKTTLTLGLLGALKKHGFRVQPFKVGPDYIDPGLHRVASGLYSHNLDAWMGSDSVVKEVFYLHAGNCDIAVIEGVMGLFDGMGNGDRGSTAHIARLLEVPVILVINARGMARSCGALIKGYCEFDPQLEVAGVIFNNVGGPKHVSTLKTVTEEEMGIPALGFVRRRSHINIPERHLGLLPAAENDGLGRLVDDLAGIIDTDVDIERLLGVARKASPLKETFKGTTERKYRVKLAVARDAAFNFYYQDSLEYLKELGADLLYFSPMNDGCLPGEIDGIYIGGGFPEMFLPALASNRSMRESVRQAAESGIPLYAECGGLMYLAEKIIDFDGNTYDGVGLVPGRVQMQKKLEALGYVTAKPLCDSILARPGEELRGHEFHYSKLTGLPDSNAAYRLYGGRGTDGRTEGFVRDNILASYLHLHFRSNPTAADRFLHYCATGRD
jgi:cobyrinic acid a,c-diamide synthase